ncbi:membrane protein [Ureibacillus massiliensis 4400831 = CIP 108448 = CCUG 49529]|uniref:Membrane protein n=1 Tax=Ureibacillus massiliensis 4400831 = CIP 108448 = CCUG 49529 TaxID=1211035 RepID=A0A0A3JTH8_9BACL|nr:hypothetical protein [Ureibacillus massiliensis]KGR90282.1 membrane protein [Ureibacillus massiliensis 4400831 = CIP 108448 = CCUG 49529]
MQQLQQYQYNDSMVFVDLAAFAAMLMAMLIIAIIFAIIGYILSAIIYSNTAKANGFHEIAFMSWIPFINVYMMFAFGAKKSTMEAVKSEALKYTLIFFGLIIISFIPFIGFLSSIALIILMVYFYYRLFFRWTGEQGKSVLFVVLTYITCGIFFFVYGFMKMKKTFVAL